MRRVLDLNDLARIRAPRSDCQPQLQARVRRRVGLPTLGKVDAERPDVGEHPGRHLRHIVNLWVVANSGAGRVDQPLPIPTQWLTRMKGQRAQVRQGTLQIRLADDQLSPVCLPEHVATR